ncbi:hypothetical protein [Nocardia brasiliensis]|uniref:hypothetical protein n=1 Tax=Nocardia brasiliensis TaxID=37326 RepID=UPI002456AF08|nr:hypothetical protein [Nocardia brasiliensis]
MPKKVGGKLIYTDDEAAALGMRMPTPEEIEASAKRLAAFDEAIRAAGPAPEGTTPGFGGRFSNDLDGTEWEGWTQDASGQWFDAEGNPVDDRAQGR